MEENYEHLEGKEIIVDDGNYQNPIKAKVGGCDRYIGLSILADEKVGGISGDWLSPGDELICIHGVNSPYRKGYESNWPEYADRYDNTFDVLVGEIEKDGVITTSVLKLLNEYKAGGGVSCGFK